MLVSLFKDSERRFPIYDDNNPGKIIGDTQFARYIPDPVLRA